MATKVHAVRHGLEKIDRLFHSLKRTDCHFTLRLDAKYEVSLIIFQAE